MKLLALCTNLPDLHTDTFNDPKILAKYPGSGAIPYLERYAKWVGYRLVSGREAMHAVQQGWVRPVDIEVLQEEFNEYGQKLVGLGCNPFLSLCLESPLYLPQYYVDPPKGFWHELSYRTPSVLSGPLLTHFTPYFPSFDADEALTQMPWRERELLCAVVSNKHVGSQDPRELQTLRYQAIEFFKPFMDLYGKSWPPGYGTEIPPGEKVSVMRRYKYALCFENYSLPGYVTEKILDCFVAGVVPIYVGPIDISTYIPSELYISIDPAPTMHFTDLLAEMKQGVGKEKVALAQTWLKSRHGHRFSYQAFARRIADLLP